MTLVDFFVWFFFLFFVTCIRIRIIDTDPGEGICFRPLGKPLYIFYIRNICILFTIFVYMYVYYLQYLYYVYYMYFVCILCACDLDLARHMVRFLGLFVPQAWPCQAFLTRHTIQTKYRISKSWRTFATKLEIPRSCLVTKLNNIYLK